MAKKNILLQVRQGTEINDLFVKTTAHNVVVSVDANGKEETLKQRLAKIAKQLGSTDLSVTEQINEVKEQVEKLIGDAPESLDSIHEIAKFLQDHENDFETLKTVADGIHAALEGKIGDLGEFATVTDYVDAKLEAAAAAEKVRCEGAIALEKARAEAAEAALGELVKDNTLAIQAVDQKVDDLIVVFESALDYDADKVKKFACIYLDDEPLEAASVADLTAALQSDNKNVVLTGDITVTESIDLSSLSIEADGYEIVAASQDVVITL